MCVCVMLAINKKGKRRKFSFLPNNEILNTKKKSFSFVSFESMHLHTCIYIHASRTRVMQICVSVRWRFADVCHHQAPLHFPHHPMAWGQVAVGVVAVMAVVAVVMVMQPLHQEIVHGTETKAG